MITYRKIVNLLKECQNKFNELEQKDRAQFLNIDIYNYRVDLTGTEWMDKYYIQCIELSLFDRNTLDIYVDLEYFKEENCVALYLENYIERNELDNIFGKNEIEDMVGVLEVRYHVISARNDTSGNFYKYPCVSSSGALDTTLVDFDITITSGIHMFLNNSETPYTLNMDTLKHFKTCSIYSYHVFLTYNEYKYIKKNNIRLGKVNRFLVGIKACTDEGIKQIISIFKYKDFYVLKDVMIKIILENHTMEEYHKWFCHLINELRSISITRKLFLHREILVLSNDKYSYLYSFDDKTDKYQEEVAIYWKIAGYMNYFILGGTRGYAIG